MYVGHRKTLHFPVYYSAFAALALFAALAVPSAATVGAALFLLGAAVHSVADMYGGGLELRPWWGTPTAPCTTTTAGPGSPPRQLVRYDGAVEDLALSIGLSLPLLYLLNGLFQQVVLGTLVVAAVYTMTRRHLAELAAWITPYAPDALLPFLPDRYHDDDPKQ